MQSLNSDKKKKKKKIYHFWIQTFVLNVSIDSFIATFLVLQIRVQPSVKKQN